MKLHDSACDARSVSVVWKSVEVFPATGASRRHFCGECDEHVHGSMTSWVYTDIVYAMITGTQGRQCQCIDLVNVYSVSVSYEIYTV